MLACAYFAASFMLTSSTKGLFQVRSFSDPVIVSLLHMAATNLISSIYLFVTGKFSTMPSRERFFSLVVYSGVFTLNIFLSNAALAYLDISLHQTLATAALVFTMIQSYLLLGTRFTVRQVFVLLGISLGAALSIGGTFEPRYIGIALSLLGSLISSLKAVLTKYLMTPSADSPDLSPLELTYWLSLLASMFLAIIALFRGDPSGAIYDAVTDGPFIYRLIGNAIAAALVNLTNPLLIQATSPLVVNILGISKNVSLSSLDLFLHRDSGFSLVKLLGVFMVFTCVTLYRIF